VFGEGHWGWIVQLAGDSNELFNLVGLRIAILDSFTLFGHALCHLLTDLGAEVVDVGWSEPALVSILEVGRSAVVVDVDVAGGSAFDAVRCARATGAQTPVIGLTAGRTVLIRKRAILSGFHALIGRSEPIPLASRALAAVCRGETDFVRDELASAESSPPELLTPRERDVLSELVNGSSTRELASSLGISEFTARTYIQRVLVKLGVHSRAEAVIHAVTGGLNRSSVSPLVLADFDRRTAAGAF
jgi:two-component system, NarL family, nitrate/nitrite response regulator NarL